MSSPDPTRGPEWKLMEALGAACAVSSAVQSGLLLALTPAPRTAEELAAKLELEATPVRLVLDVLVAEGFAARVGDRYSGSDGLVRTLAGMPGDALLPYRGLVPLLSGGQRAVEMDRDPETRASAYRSTTPALADAFADAADELAAALGPVQRVLDLGCGAGGWSLAVARKNPCACVTGVDFPAVLDAMRERARDERLTERVELVAADLRSDELPTGFDTVLLANVLRLEGGEVARAMLARATSCVGPGGRLVVVDALADETPAARRSLALYALHLSLRTQRGAVHARVEVETWLRELGFRQVEKMELTRGPAHLAALVAS